MVKFPEDFYFGSATSSAQCEGNRTQIQDIWDKWHHEDPKRFYDGVGPSDTSTFYKHFREDIALLKKTGHNSFRTSISWAHLLPDGKHVDEKACQFYHDVFYELKLNNIEPFVTLYHFDMPVFLYEIGGFEHRDSVDMFQTYASICFDRFQDLVKHWFTFNEPIVHVEGMYLEGFHYPCKVDPKAGVQAAYHMALASASAIQVFHERKLDGKIGIVLNLTPAYPRSTNSADIQASRIAELFANSSFLDPAILGHYDMELIEIIKKHDLLPAYTKTDLEVIEKNTIDFLGVNYYQPLRVCAKKDLPNPNAPFTPKYYYDIYAMAGRRMNPYRGWEIYPKGLYDIAIRIRDQYQNIEWMVTENGMGVEGEERFVKEGVIQDDYRIDFYKEHLFWLEKGMKEGSHCIGYHVWTGIDNWSWLNAYKNRYGLIALDLKTQKRTIKKSGYWFAEMVRRHGFFEGKGD